MSGENRPEERAELESRAFWALEHLGQVEPREAVDRLQQMLRLWQYPAFDQYSAWAVFIPRREALVDETRVLIREVTWDRPHDLQRFANPLEWLKQGYRTPPLLHVQDVKIAYSRISALLGDLARLPVQVVAVQTLIGLDGEEFGFEYSASFLIRARLEWWCDGPTEWRAFIDCVARLRETLQQSVSGEAYEA